MQWYQVQDWRCSPRAWGSVDCRSEESGRTWSCRCEPGQSLSHSSPRSRWMARVHSKSDHNYQTDEIKIMFMHQLASQCALCAPSNLVLNFIIWCIEPVTRCSSIRPVAIIKVSVGVSSLALIVLVVSGRLPPHSVVYMRLAIPVRIVWREEIPVKIVKKMRVSIIVLHQLVQHPGSHSWGDPLSSMNTTVNPHCRFVSTTSFANLHKYFDEYWSLIVDWDLHDDHLLALEWFSDVLHLAEVVVHVEPVKPAVDLVQEVVAVPVHAVPNSLVWAGNWNLLQLHQSLINEDDSWRRWWSWVPERRRSWQTSGDCWSWASAGDHLIVQETTSSQHVYQLSTQSRNHKDSPSEGLTTSPPQHHSWCAL